MVVETRIIALRCSIRTEHHNRRAPLEEGPSYLRLVCRVTVRYASSRLGGGGAAEVVRAEATRTHEAKHVVDGGASAFYDLDGTRRAVWRWLVAMPELRGGPADPSPSNWNTFVPDFVAPVALRVVRENEDGGMCGGHYRFVAKTDLEVTLVFSEPKAVLRHCREEVMQTVEPATTGDACGICLDGLACSGGMTAPQPPVNLPCGHAFHSQCITRWLFKGTACPLCRHDLRGLVASPWNSANTCALFEAASPKALALAPYSLCDGDTLP